MLIRKNNHQAKAWAHPAMHSLLVHVAPPSSGNENPRGGPSRHFTVVRTANSTAARGFSMDSPQPIDSFVRGVKKKKRTSADTAALRIVTTEKGMSVSWCIASHQDRGKQLGSRSGSLLFSMSSKCGPCKLLLNRTKTTGSIRETHGNVTTAQKCVFSLSRSRTRTGVVTRQICNFVRAPHWGFRCTALFSMHLLVNLPCLSFVRQGDDSTAGMGSLMRMLSRA